jgi:uncharacterized protein YggE
MKTAALIASAMMVSAGAMAAAAQAQTSVNIAETAPVVTLNVTRSVEHAPDIATIGTGVETRAPTAKQAMADNAGKAQALIAALAKAGIAKKDIQTSGVRLSAQYDYGQRNPDGSQAQPRFLGYEASNQLSVIVRNVAKVGDVLDAMVAAGATSINGPTFGIDDVEPLVVQARGDALKTAQAQADYYAKQAGFRAARLVSITDNGGSGGAQPVPMMAMMKADRAASTPIEPGQVSASVTLTVQYALER